MKRSSVLLLIFFFIQIGHGESINQTSILDKHLAKCLHLLNTRNYIQLLPEAQKGLKMSKRDFVRSATFYYYLGCAHQFSTKQNDSAIYYYEKSIYFAGKSNYAGQFAITSRQLLYLYYVQKQRVKQTELAQKMVSMLHQTTNKPIRASLLYVICDYNLQREQYEALTHHAIECINLLSSDSILTRQSRKDIGGLYLKLSIAFESMHQLDKAIEYCRLAENEFEPSDLENRSSTYDQFVRFYIIKNQIDKSLNYLSKIHSLDTNSAFKEVNLGNSYNCIADYYLKKDKPQKAIFFSQKAKYYSELSRDGELISIATVLQARILFHLRKYDSAINTLKTIESDSKKYNKQIYINLTELLSRCYKSKEDYKNASIYQDITTQLSDSILRESANQNIAKAEALFQNKLKQQEINTLVSQNKIALLEQKQIRFKLLVLILLVIIAVLVGGAFFIQSRNRKKANQQLRVLNNQLDEANRVKMRFFGILNHDLRSPLSNLIQILDFKNEEAESVDAATIQKLETNAVNSARNLLASMEDMLLWGKGQMNNFNPQMSQVSVEDLFRYIAVYFETEKEVKFSFDNADSVVLTTDENILKTILRNLTSNAIKALRGREHQSITWTAAIEKGRVSLTIADNGPGISADQLKALYDENQVVGVKNGLGLHLIRDLCSLIDCTVTMVDATKDGTIFKLNFA